MQVVKKNLTDTNVQLTLTADADILSAAKEEALQEIGKTLRLPGFRQGKAPLNLIEKHADASALGGEFLERAMNRLYSAALTQEKLRPVQQPKVTVKKFVPFEELEIEAEVETIPDVRLPDYKKIKVEKPAVKVTAKDIDDVLENLQGRTAEKKDVDRAAKQGDQVWIDFSGKDAKTKEAIAGADGQNYPLVLGSGTFIPGFEENLAGMKANDEKTFDVTFPADYGVAALQKRKVQFTVTVSKVQEVVKPKVDDAFAASIGPFKTVADLKADIKKQLQAEREQQAERDFADAVLTEITKKTKVQLPPVLIDEQLDRMVQDQRQNIIYRGQTWEEFLKAEGLDEKAFRAKIRPDASLRVQAGITLAEIGERERVTITPEELDARMQQLHEQYKDDQMRAELAKPEAKRDIASRMLTEKTLSLLTTYASAA